MGVSGLTLTQYGVFTVSGAALKTAVDAIDLALATDFLYITPVGEGQVNVMKVEREA